MLRLMGINIEVMMVMILFFVSFVAGMDTRLTLHEAWVRQRTRTHAHAHAHTSHCSWRITVLADTEHRFAPAPLWATLILWIILESNRPGLMWQRWIIARQHGICTLSVKRMDFDLRTRLIYINHYPWVGILASWPPVWNSEDRFRIWVLLLIQLKPASL